MTGTCSCPPGDCHGGHTTQIGPVARLTDEQIVDLVQRWKAGESVNASRPEVNSMAAELLAARTRITELEAERDQHAETARQALDMAVNHAATLAMIRHALSDHPRCDVHPDDDVIKCGWKRAVASVQWALDQSGELPEGTE